jgi:hypothetical protein
VHSTLRIYERREKLEQEIAKEACERRSSLLPPTIKFGDFFELSKELEDKCVDCTLTSPPFDKPLQWFQEMLREVERLTIDYAIIFSSSRNLIDIVRATTPVRVLIWYKQITQEPFRYEPILVYKFETARYNINSRINRDVFPYSPPEPQERLHRISRSSMRSSSKLREHR